MKGLKFPKNRKFFVILNHEPIKCFKFKKKARNPNPLPPPPLSNLSLFHFYLSCMSVYTSPVSPPSFSPSHETLWTIQPPLSPQPTNTVLTPAAVILPPPLYRQPPPANTTHTTTSSRFNLNILPAYTLNVHWMCIECIWNVHLMHISCTLISLPRMQCPRPFPIPTRICSCVVVVCAVWLGADTRFFTPF